jgi:hypothetical protein
MRELRALASRRLLAAGIFPAEPIPRDAVATGVLGPPRTIGRPWDLNSQINEELLANHISPAAVRAVTIALLAPRSHERIPPQYAAFNIAAHRLGIINYNNDGLATRYCHAHAVVNVHGTTLSAGTLERLEWEDWVDIYQEFPDLPAIRVPGLYFPEPESLGMMFGRVYGEVWRLLGSARRLAIIGYSFGEGDDWIGYHYVQGALSARSIPAVVVKPDSDYLVQRLIDDSGNRNIIGLSMYWDRLACAILATRLCNRYKTCLHGRLCARCIDYTYCLFMDSGFDWIELTNRFDLTSKVSY